MNRSILAVLGGFILLQLGVSLATFVAYELMLGGLPGDEHIVPTTSYLVVNAAYCGVLAVGAGFITGVFAGSKPLAHAAALAAILLILSVSSLARPSGVEPGWYVTTLAVVGPLGSLIGGILRMRHKRDALSARAHS